MLLLLFPSSLRCVRISIDKRRCEELFWRDVIDMHLDGHAKFGVQRSRYKGCHRANTEGYKNKMS